MAFPAGVTLVTVTGKVSGVPDGLPATVKFTAADWAVGPAANALWPGFTRHAVVAANGTFSIDLPATDDPAWTPVDWSYTVTLTYGDTTATGTLTVPYDGGTFDLADRIDLGGTVTAGVTYMPLSLRSAAGGVAGLDVDGDVIDASGAKITGGGGGGASPSSTVVAETTYGASSTAGAATAYSRGDHTHGTPGLGTTSTTAAAGNHAHTGVYQPLDSDLTTIAGLTATTDNTMQGVAGAWASRTPAQVKTALAIGISDVASLQAGLDDKAPLASPALTGNPTAPTQTAGNNSTRLATTAFVTTAVAGGGGGSALVVKRAVVTSGNITPQNTAAAWQPLTGGPTLVIPAAVGDYISVDIASLIITKVATTFYDLAVLNGASLVRFGSSGTGTPATEGDGSLYHDTSFPRVGTIFDFVAEAGDINAGNITICVAVNSVSAAGAFHAGFYPFRWRVLNHGAVTVS